MVFLLLVIGIIFAGLGGELFVKGAVGVASWAKIPAGIIGATIAAFATSSPELSVSIISATNKKSELALGDAIGSNLTNICLVLGIALILKPLKVSKRELKRDLPFAIIAPVLVLVLSIDKKINYIDGIVMILFFTVWLMLGLIQTIKARSETSEVLGEKKINKSVIFLLAGLILLVSAGYLIVDGAKAIGDLLGWDTFIVGATFVALGTSTPELATTIISRMRGHDDIGVGTVIGSNIFNMLLIVAIAAIIYPIKVSSADITAPVLLSLISMVLLIPLKSNVLNRSKGYVLVAIYIVYILYTTIFIAH
ncbi:MAG: calcium/sodium antiporter [Acidimicrobiia bacterium]